MTDMMTQTQRFMSHVRKIESGCWIWAGSLNACGYGTFNGGRSWLAHRWAYRYIGKRKLSEELHHLCKVRSCVNPEHLEATSGDEHPDKPSNLNRRKQFCPQGHPYSGANLYTDPVGHRHCLTCRSAVSRVHYAQHRLRIRKQQNAYYRRNAARIRAVRKKRRQRQ